MGVSRERKAAKEMFLRAREMEAAARDLAHAAGRLAHVYAPEQRTREELRRDVKAALLAAAGKLTSCRAIQDDLLAIEEETTNGNRHF